MNSYNKILTGSSVFFKDYLDFNPTDTDYIILIENPTCFKNLIHFKSKMKKEDIFVWRKMCVDEFIQVTYEYDLPMSICKFLTPEFNKQIGFTIDRLPELQGLVDKLEGKHSYLRIIYESYLANNDFVLTDEQRDVAYALYKNFRNDN